MIYKQSSTGPWTIWFYHSIFSTG